MTYVHIRLCRHWYLSAGHFWRRDHIRSPLFIGIQHQYREPARVKRATDDCEGGKSAGGGSGGSAAELELDAAPDAAAAGPADGSLADPGFRKVIFRAAALVDARST